MRPASLYRFVIFFSCMGTIYVSYFPIYPSVHSLPSSLRKLHFPWKKGSCKFCVCVWSASSTYYCYILMDLSSISVSLYEWRNELMGSELNEWYKVGHPTLNFSVWIKTNILLKYVLFFCIKVVELLAKCFVSISCQNFHLLMIYFNNNYPKSPSVGIRCWILVSWCLGSFSQDFTYATQCDSSFSIQIFYFLSSHLADWLSK